MAKQLRGMGGDYDMGDLAGRKKGRKKAKKKGAKKASKKFSAKGFKVVAKTTCVRQSGKAKGTLKKGCKWGRGKFKGKVLKKVA